MVASRCKGCVLGLACGDAVGTTLEINSRGSFQPVRDTVGGGVGQITGAYLRHRQDTRRLAGQAGEAAPYEEPRKCALRET